MTPQDAPAGPVLGDETLIKLATAARDLAATSAVSFSEAHSTLVDAARLVAQARADEADKIASYLTEQAASGQESELVASAVLDYAQLIREGSHR